MNMFPSRVDRFPLKNRKRLAICQPRIAPDGSRGKSITPNRAGSAQIYKNTLGQVVLIWTQAANAVGEAFRQHRKYAIRKVNTVASPEGFAIERRPCFDVVRHIRNVNAHGPTVFSLCNMDSVIEIARILRIDRKYRSSAQIFPTGEINVAQFKRNLVCLLQHLLRK